MATQSWILRLLYAIWRGLDHIRRILHFIFLVGIVIALIVLAAPRVQPIPDSAALILAPQGALVDQLSGDPLQRAIAAAQGAGVPETLLSDLIEAVRRARDDSRIRALVLDLDRLGAAGLSKLQELADELRYFKESGKPVLALGDSFSRNQYFLAAHADEVYLHPMGSVLVDGYSRYLPYYKTALDKLYVDFHTWTVGEYKSFVEPFTRDDMSDEDRAASRAYLDAMWDAYQADVAAARELAADSLQRYADDAVALLESSGGDSARLALDYGLVDGILTRDAMRRRVAEIVGEHDEFSDGFAGVMHAGYLAATRARDLPLEPDRQIGVVVASGTILDGRQPPGTVGGDSLAALIREAAADEGVRGLVLRVDSPGGSAFASDVILRELEVFQQSGRPVVVSMGSVAASGGYWISMAADEIWASPTTLTGSIGVGATLPTFDRTLEQIGVNVDGVGTTQLSGMYDLTQPLADNVDALVQLSVGHIYERFVSSVAEHRDQAVDDIDAVARGRVWIGSDAAERGLVDGLGHLDDAIDAAAGLAGLESGDYGVTWIEPQLSFAERLALGIVRVGAPLIAANGRGGLPDSIRRLVESAAGPLEFVERLNDPRGIYAYCFCDVR